MSVVQLSTAGLSGNCRTIDVESIVKQVTVWAPTDDEIVPVRLAKSLSNRLINSTTIEVPGAHDWLLENWSTVLERVSS